MCLATAGNVPSPFNQRCRRRPRTMRPPDITWKGGGLDIICLLRQKLIPRGWGTSHIAWYNMLQGVYVIYASLSSCDLHAFSIFVAHAAPDKRTTIRAFGRLALVSKLLTRKSAWLTISARCACFRNLGLPFLPPDPQRSSRETIPIPFGCG